MESAYFVSFPDNAVSYGTFVACFIGIVVLVFLGCCGCLYYGYKSKSRKRVKLGIARPGEFAELQANYSSTFVGNESKLPM